MANPIDAHRGTTYSVWVDSSKRVATSTKISNAILHYKAKYGKDPNEIIVHESALGTKSDVPMRSADFANENYFYLPIPDT